MFRKSDSNLPAEIPAAMRASAQRQADRDLLARLAAGSIIYPVMLLLVGITTPFRVDHPRLFWLIACAVGLALALRFALNIFREQLDARRRWAFVAPLLVSICLSGGAGGFLLLNAAMNYGFSSWTFTVTLLWMAGIASGSTISFTPSFPFLLAQLLTLLAPIILYELLLGSSQGLSLGLATFTFFGFHVAQGYRLNGMYWNLLSSRALDSLRVEELEAAKSAAEQAHEQLRHQATHDTLTGVLNRAQILAVLDREMEGALAAQLPLSILMLDLDFFRRVNEQFGHLGGDEVLRAVAARVRCALRPGDAVGRYGGEEFLIVLPGCDVEKSAACAERIRRAIASDPVSHDHFQVAVTASFGVTAFHPGSDTDQRQVIARADRALYRAKRKGKNRVEVH